MIHFTDLSSQVYKEVHVFNVNLSIHAGEEKITKIIMLGWAALGAKSQVLGNSSSLALSVG